ncbi:hypothetical protein [Moritella sp. F3]|uniref:hypothetical protein n=1 Tax=Moritella sp. F3 TaxID=2718882 RepID=UPI0018E1D69A|nr:hypothetical protein [Moritella sp. F3]
MFKTIKAIFQGTANSTLAEYYLARLQTSKSAVEIEAIFSLNAFMSFNETEEQQDEVLK